MVEKKRMANYELLRMLAMVMVVLLHFLSHSDSLLEPELSLTAQRFTGSLLEAFCLVAVNVYLFISGYFGVKGSFKATRALSLLCQIWFYALLIPLFLTLLGLETAAGREGIYGLLSYVFPIETEHYWFATAYFLLYLLTPVLNKAVQSMKRVQLELTLAGLFIVLCLIKSISPFAFAFDRYGYDLPWFIFVYLLAGYLGMWGEKPCDGRKEKNGPVIFLQRYGLWIYLFSCLFSFLLQLLMWKLSVYSDSFVYYFSVPYHYNFLLCLLGSVGLFFGFSHVRIKEGRLAEGIRKAAPLSFGIYLLHEHTDLRSSWYGWLSAVVNPAGKDGFFVFLAELVFCVLVLFFAGIAVDFIRSRLFAAVGKKLSHTRLLKKLKELDKEMEREAAGA